MRRLSRVLLSTCLATGVLVCTAATGRASFDMVCDPALRLPQPVMTGCVSSAMLSPGGDTRMTMALLLGDRFAPDAPHIPTSTPFFSWSAMPDLLHPPAPQASAGGAAEEPWSPPPDISCVQAQSGQKAFEQAVKADATLAEPERAALLALRGTVFATCPDYQPAALDEALKGVALSPAGRALAAYIRAADAFYAADYPKAVQMFAALSGAPQGWVKETARYMQARAMLAEARTLAVDEYGDLTPPEDPAKRQALDKAAQDGLAGLTVYLKDYPAGLYAASAKGLYRWGYRLGQNQAALQAEYLAMLTRPPAERGVPMRDFIQELDNRLVMAPQELPLSDPILWATAVLSAQRDDGDPAFWPSVAGLHADQKALHDYLAASQAFYIDHKPEQVLALIPDPGPAGDGSALTFSRQMLRAMAVQALNKPEEGESWRALLAMTKDPARRTLVELGLALYEQRHGDVRRVFAADSPIRGWMVRETLLTRTADAALLLQQAGSAQAPAHEREVALFTLLYKELTRGAPGDFVRHLALIPTDAAKGGVFALLSPERPPLKVFTEGTTASDYPCPSLQDTASRLAASPADISASLCLADFVRLNGFDDFVLDQSVEGDQLGSGPSLFTGAAYARQAIYQKVLATPTATADERAYALFRAVRCYAPSGINSCGGAEVPPSQRKAWFSELKKSYPKSRWAQGLTYYW
ncbi:hypothetical protein [Insolitispirillum peregrinum]|uniref:Outer membrane assembly lipoprotein YfiO n=1 Tax=Insolitispirillum peregrinum TaxID=80876 RepID=A0A1N7L0V9_9PROT|nr:hypothetical protein [Insolitispirillum peregrinum]SIS67475.1 hypothetical protein SAMN05421779_10336 [Insolitispirillum peregrinum]